MSRSPAGRTTRRTLVLVDGSNVAQCSPWIRSIPRIDREDHVHVRRRLVDAVVSWSGDEGVDVHLVFDGEGPWRAGVTSIAPGFVVEGSGGGKSGDDLIERAAVQARADGRRHWLVTSDRTLGHVAGTGAERVLGADEFIETWIAGGRRAGVDDPTAEPPPASTGIGGLLRADVASRLERLRRGEGT